MIGIFLFFIFRLVKLNNIRALTARSTTHYLPSVTSVSLNFLFSSLYFFYFSQNCKNFRFFVRTTVVTLITGFSFVFFFNGKNTTIIIIVRYKILDDDVFKR